MAIRQIKEYEQEKMMEKWMLKLDEDKVEGRGTLAHSRNSTGAPGMQARQGAGTVRAGGHTLVRFEMGNWRVG